MKQLLIIFDKKSLVIPNEDYEIFSNENYNIDDGTTHYFFKQSNGLIIMNNKQISDIGIFFSEITIDGEKKYEISRIKKTLNKDISPEINYEQAKKDVSSIIKEVLTLLDDILQKRAQPDDIRALGYKYYIPDTDTHTCKALISLQGRFSYLQFIPQLDYAFGLLDE